MGLLDRFKRLIYLRSNSQGGRSGTTVPGGQDDDDDNALSIDEIIALAHRHPVVCIAVAWLTKQGSSTPYIMQNSLPDGEVEEITDHPLLDLLNKPSDFLSGQELLAVTIRNMAIHGQAFWKKERLRGGGVDSLSFLSAKRTTVHGDDTTLITHYEYRPKGGIGPPEIYQPDQIVHIRLEPDPDDPKNGLSPLICVANELMLDNGSQQFVNASLTNHGSPGGFLVPVADEVLDEDVADETRQYIRKNFSGVNRGEIGVLRARMEYIRTALDPASMAVGDTLNTAEERICGALGVHPVVVGLGAGSSQSRVGAATIELERAAWNNGIIPLQRSIAQQITRQMIPEFVSEAEIKQWMVQWDRSDVLALQPDLGKEAERWQTLVVGGIATRYDARRALQLEVEDFDKVYVLSNRIVLVGPEERPQPALSGSVSGAVDEEEEDNEPRDRSAPATALLKAARSKAAVNDEQRGVMVALARDAETLTALFGEELEEMLEDLGERAVEAFWAVEGGEAVLSMGNRYKNGQNGGGLLLQDRVKQGEAEITAEVNRIVAGMRINQWVQNGVLPLYEAHYLRVLVTTVETVNSSLGLAVNLPDPVARGVVSRGGTRLGLVDFAEQTRASLFDVLTEARAAGHNPITIARQIQADIPAGRFTKAGSKYRAELIARTETANAQNVSTRAAYQQSDVITGLLCVDAQFGDTDGELRGGSMGNTFTFAEAQQVGDLEHPLCTRQWLPVVDRAR